MVYTILTSIVIFSNVALQYLISYNLIASQSGAMLQSYSSTLYDHHVGVEMSSVAHQVHELSEDRVRSMQISKDKGKVARRTV